MEKPSVLSVISSNSRCVAPSSPGLIPSGLTSLSGDSHEVIECTDSQVSRGVTGNCYWSRANEIMLTAIWIPPQKSSNIEQSTQSAYTELLEHLVATGFSKPFRFWNFIPKINEGLGDLEEYKKFCVGRLKAFESVNLDTSEFPAASALGHNASGAVIYALSSTESSTHYENPLQQSAYHYPREYGPSSPSFARASKISIEGCDWVFISGTASILGHETQCPEDLSEQLRITLNNIEHLSRHIGGDISALKAIRVYLRDPQHYEYCQTYLSKRLPNCEITYTLADICRANLLVEIEANFSMDSC